MAVSEFLDFLQVTDTQAQKMAALSQMAEQIGQNLAEVYTLDVSSAVNTSTDEFVLPYDDTDDLSDRSGIRFIYLRLTGTPTVDFFVYHPTVKHLFFVENNTPQEARVLPVGGVHTQNARIPNLTGNIIYCDGSFTYTVLPDQRTNWWPLEVQFWGKPAASEEIGRMIMPRDVTILENTTEIVGKVTANPSSTYTIDVYEDTIKYAEIRITTGGVFSYVSTVSGDLTIEAGNELIFYAPASVDATIENIRFAINGRLVIG